MIPLYKPGDHVLTYNWPRIKKGDVIVFTDRGMKLIKRVVAIDGDSFYVSGDNKKESSKVGPVRKDEIVGKVLLKY